MSEVSEQEAREYAGMDSPYCDDCKMQMAVPFDMGDGKVRCAACAVDRYMKLTGGLEVVLAESIIKAFRSSIV